MPSKLRRIADVLVHTPGDEAGDVTPDNRKELYFTDVPDPDQLRQQHRAFIELLASEGVSVHQVRDKYNGPGHLLRDPNLYFTNDLGTSLGDVFVVSSFQHPVRQPESLVAENVFNNLGLRTIKLSSPATIEGNDFTFLDHDTALLGIGPRTNIEGYRQLRTLCRERDITLIPVPLVPKKYYLHLNMVVTILDKGMALFFPPVFSTEILEELDTIDTWIPVSLGEQRTKGTNVLRLDRGKVVAYDINPETNACLRAHDIEVLEIEGSELVKGGGGPRCMCLPTAWCD